MSDYEMHKAREIAEARYSFRWHLLIYLVVNSGLVGIWYYYTASSFPWPIFPAFFWAIGLLSHYLAAYRRGWGRDWIENETERILREEKEKGR